MRQSEYGDGPKPFSRNRRCTIRMMERSTWCTILGLCVAAIALMAGPVTNTAAVRKQNTLPAEVKTILDAADRFTLMSLDPNPVIQRKSGKPRNETFHSYPVLRKCEIRTAKERDQLLRTLYKGIGDSDGTVALCFNPRHGIRAVRGEDTVDLVICFECFSIQIHGKVESDVLTTGSPASAFSRALKRGALAPAKPPR